MPVLPPAVFPAPMSDLIPDIHLSRLAGLTAPRIVIVGDSISTPKPLVTHDMIDGFWGYFQRAFLLANPGLTPEFVNRAIGRTQFIHFAEATLAETLAANHDYPWASDPEARWFDIVEAEQPDLLIQGFGMNDAGQFDTGKFLALQARIDAWEKQPDRIYMTAMLPSRTGAAERLSNEEGQAGRMYNAHYIRSWTQFHGYGLIDINRAQLRAVQGIDPRVSSLVRMRGQRPTIPSQSPKSCQDFGLVLSGATIAEDLAAGLRVQIGAGHAASRDQAALTLQADAEGHLVLRFFDRAAPADPYLTHRSPDPVPEAPETLSVFVKDIFAHVEIDGQSAFFGRIRRHGGRFEANLARLDDAQSSTEVRYFFGSLHSHAPTLTDDKAFGGGPTKHRVGGGNAINHPSSLLSASVFAPLLDSINLTIRRAPRS
ncbi:MAG: hypothetical protein ACWA5A_06480 [Marinibacterium sp.]